MLGVDNLDRVFVSSQDLTLRFEKPVQALGLYVVTEPFDILPDNLKLTANGVAVSASTTPANVLLDLGEVYFFGIIADTPGEAFTSAILESATLPGTGVFTYNIDDISTFPVPTRSEPVPVTHVSLAAMFLALFVPALRRMRR
jgi:hypothetical protein